MTDGLVPTPYSFAAPVLANHESPVGNSAILASVILFVPVVPVPPNFYPLLPV